MQFGKFNVVTDGQFGSCGKGAITTALSIRHKPQIISTTNMPNAGHTAVYSNGDKFVAKALPSAAILHKWLSDYKPDIILGSSAAFTIPQLEHEIGETGCGDHLIIHKRAGVITEAHKQAECDAGGTKHLASTMQGCGSFLAEKVLRKQNVKLAVDYPELSRYIPAESLPIALHRRMQRDSCTILHEGAQGFSLDINHGQSYPFCTSRGTTAMQNLADMGIHPYMLGDVYVLYRPFPIRVGNVVENGVTTGHSGGCYDDQEEISWDDVRKACNGPEDLAKGELTTVTKRLRRTFTFSKKQLLESAIVNGATNLVLTFANYIDWSCYGISDYDALPQKVKDFAHMMEDVASVPVTMIETGPQTDHICYVD